MGAYVSPPMYQRHIAQRYRLVAARCTKCGGINFPPQGVCRHCLNSFEFEEISLSGRGKIASHARISAGGAPPEFAEQAAVRGDYVVAIIELEEGPRLTAQLVDCNHVQIGMPVEATMRRIYVDEGVIRYGYKFKPV